MSFLNEKKHSSDETEATKEFFLKWARMIDPPPLTEEFYVRLRQRLQRSSSSTEDSALEDELPMPLIKATQARRIMDRKVRKKTKWWKGGSFFGGAVTAALVIIVGAFLLHVAGYELPLYTYDKRSAFDRKPDSMSGISLDLQEIKRKDKELYESLAIKINEMRDRLNDPKAITSTELMQSLDPIMEEIDIDNRASLKQLELILKNSSGSDGNIVYIIKNGHSVRFDIDKDTSENLVSLLLGASIKIYSGAGVIEEGNKLQ